MSIFHKSRGPYLTKQITWSIAPFSLNRSVAQILNMNLLTIDWSWFFINQIEHKIQRIEVRMLENILHCTIVLSYKERKYLRKDHLFGSEKGAIPIIEVHFLCVPFRVMGNPQLLGSCLQPDVNQSQREDKRDCEGSNKNDESIVVVESTDLLENELEVHLFPYQM